MGRLETYLGLIDYYEDGRKMCKKLKSCDECPLLEKLDDGRTGCGLTIFSFGTSVTPVNAEIGKAVKKMRGVARWWDEHPEEEESNDVI